MSPKHPAKERAWGTRYDTLESSPGSSPSQHRSGTPPATHSPTPTTVAESPSRGLCSPKGGHLDPTPHDASIFIGSLPANIDHSELTQRLSEHFSAHPQVKAIKVVRDSRGGVCGFIQCESPVAAGRMLQDLAENPPRPFCGRFLRFEAAKAFRTLLISYRVPTEVAYTVCSDDPFGSPGGRPASMGLAHAIRIFRPRNARHLGILYNSEALDFDSSTAAEPQGDVSDAFCGEGLLIQALRYDEKTIQRIVSAFGPLETFKMGSTDVPDMPPESKHDLSLYPYPHDAPRSPEMSRGVWEVKWRNREDSVLALLTLRRIPHLMVNWAHHHPLTVNTDPFNTKDGPFTKGLWLSPTMRRGYSEHSGRDGRGSPSTSHISHAPATTLLQPISYRTESPDASSRGHTSPPAKGTLATSDLSPPSGATLSHLRGTSSRWADQVTELDVYGEIGPPACKTPSTPSLNGVCANKPPSPFTNTMGPSVADQSPRDPPGTFFSPTLRLSSALSDVDRKQSSALRTETLQAIASTGHRALPHRPQSSQVSRPIEPSDIDSLSTRLRDLPTGAIDPRTVFVGGLNVQDADEWDEHRLRRIFDQYGLIESVQIVRPLTKRTCFAFVQFANAESATRAVRDEHNRVHDGRPLRVQLRDRNPPPHASWGLGRGRGRNRFGGTSRPHQDAPGYVNGGTVDPAAVHVPLELPGAPIPTTATHGSPSLAPDNYRTGMLRAPGHGDLQRRSSYGMPNSSTSSVSSGTTKVPSVHGHGHGPSSTTTSPAPLAPISTSSALSAMAPFPPHHMSVGYFPPQPWVQPYHAQYSYPMPVMPSYAYPGYAYSHVPHAPPAFVTSGANGLGSSISSSAFADITPNHADKTANSDEHGSQLQSGTQPPLRPTGFIQNEAGTLIPVYQREALDHYMASVHPGEPSPQTSTMPTQMASTSAAGVASWPTPSFPYYGAPYPTMGHSAPVHPPPVQGGYWFPGGTPHTVAPFPPTQPPSVPSQPFHPSVAGPASDGTSRVGPPPNAHGQYLSGQRGGFHPRRYNRRDNPYGGHTFNGPQHVRFPNQPSPATHAFVRGP